MGRDLERLGKEELIAAVRALERRMRDDKERQRVTLELRAHQEQLRLQQEQLVEVREQLEASRDRYADLFDFAPIGYLVFDGNGVVTDVNLKAASLLGLERGRVLDLPLIVFAAPGDRPRLLEHLQRCRRGDPSVRTELQLGRGERTVCVELMSRPWTSRLRDRTVYHTAVLDLTERREAERIQHEAEQERQANEAKSRFLAMLSHELRTPLTPILFELNALAQRNVAPDVQAALAVVARNARAEAKLVDDLLDVTSITQGQLQLTRRALDVHAVLADTLDDSAQLVREAGLALSVDLGADRTCVSGDALRLRQVFANLVHNAVKYTPPGGEIRVRSVAEHTQLRVEVEDTGTGFDPADATRLFEPFVRMPTAAEPCGGLGLGLAISKSLVESHDGTFEAWTSGPGRGARFVVHLPLTDGRPLADDERARKPPRRHDDLPARPLRILLVEDHADTATALAELLALDGHVVVAAASAAEALARATEDIDVVVSDLGLPDGTGYDLVRCLHQRRHVPAIALSGYGASEDVERSLDAGFQRHLTKPVDGSAVMEAVRDVLCKQAS